MSSSSSLAAGARVGPYEVLALLGEGGGGRREPSPEKE